MSDKSVLPDSVMTYFLVGVLVLLLLYAGVPWSHGRFARISLRRKAEKKNAMVLTFDDGPGDKLTHALLKLLAEHNARATFFLLGRNIAGREELARQISQNGHEVCSHGFDHLHEWKVSPFRALSDIRRGWKAIDTALGTERGKYPFRPPNGKMNIVCLLYLMFLRVPIVYWSEDSGDTWATKPQSNKVALVARKAGGVVSLAHDFDRSNDNTDQFVLESARAALSMAREQDMRVLTVSQLLSGDRQVID